MAMRTQEHCSGLAADHQPLVDDYLHLWADKGVDAATLSRWPGQAYIYRQELWMGPHLERGRLMPTYLHMMHVGQQGPTCSCFVPAPHYAIHKRTVCHDPLLAGQIPFLVLGVELPPHWLTTSSAKGRRPLTATSQTRACIRRNSCSKCAFRTCSCP